MKKKCDWCLGDPLYEEYHDKEWGVPTFDDTILFEFLILESMQAGLSWITILKKREAFREAFDDFDYTKIAKYDERKVEELMKNEKIIRNRLKILATINNAKCFLEVQKEFASFSEYIWSFTKKKQVLGQWNHIKEVPCDSPLSKQVSLDMKKRGFHFLGPIIMYSYLQAVGVINDHLLCCFRHEEIKKKYKK